MGLLNKIITSFLGLKGIKPANFGVNPIPPNSLHNSYSVDGIPNITRRGINSIGQKPQPSRLDELDTNAPNLQIKGVVSRVYKSSNGKKYMDNKPK